MYFSFVRKPIGEVWLPLLVGFGAACSAFGTSSSSGPAADGGIGATGALPPLPCAENGCTGEDVCCAGGALVTGATDPSYTCMAYSTCSASSDNASYVCDGDARCAAFGPDYHCCGYGSGANLYVGTHCVRTKCPDGEASVCVIGQRPDPCVAPDSCTQTIRPAGYGVCLH